MTDIRTVECTSPDEIDMELVAKRVAQTLANHYPDHLWAVGWHLGNNIVIKNLAISAQIGRVIHYPDCSGSSDLDHKVMVAGGALLELAAMPRGKWDGQIATELDGQPSSVYHAGLRK